MVQVLIHLRFVEENSGLVIAKHQRQLLFGELLELRLVDPGESA
jgi:hypothetical protein